MSHHLVAEYRQDICGIPCSTGWISKLQTIVSHAVLKPYEQIASQGIQAPVVHVDKILYAIEAGLSMFRIVASRAEQIAYEIVGEEFSGIIISDLYSRPNILRH
ncbi:MAG TPA: hypothetical protein DIW81_24605 [Planctomycetaceae bacterium]|nr:hypothetical protein [Planctomycetaceae bacterium]